MTEAATKAAKSASVTTSRRALLLHDGLTFFTLGLAALALYAITFFLFRSFESHREELARRWSDRGRAALTAGQPAQAILPLRAALSYAPDDDDYQMLLAEALAGAGHLEEASNYFLNLWESRPGDGFLNLQLARLERKKGETQLAIQYYHASIYGGWQANGLESRRAVRLELADYLMQQHDFSAARAELLISAANTPDTPELDRMLGDRLALSGDPADALTLYRKAIVDDPHSRLLLEKAGTTAFALSDYFTADRLLHRALQAKPEPGDSLPDGELAALAHDSARLLELSLSRDLPPSERAQHLGAGSRIAQNRLNSCAAQLAPASPSATQQGSLPWPTSSVPVAAPASKLSDLRARWKAATNPATFRTLRTDNASQDSMAGLIEDTEQQTATLCGEPVGDDALLLKLARSAAIAERQ